MVASKLCTLFLLLAAAVFGHGGCEAPSCSGINATSCYWNIADKYVMKELFTLLAADKEQLKELCSKENPLPPVPECSKFYAGCSKEVRRHFVEMESGYHTLQSNHMDKYRCEGLDALKSCADMAGLLRECRMNLRLEPTEENVRYNSNIATSLDVCIQKFTGNCYQEVHQYNAVLQISNTYMVALWDLVSHYSA